MAKFYFRTIDLNGVFDSEAHDFADHHKAIAYARRILFEMIFDDVPPDSNGDIAIEIYAFDRRRIAVLRHRLTIETDDTGDGC
jgi:hypothetical protein